MTNCKPLKPIAIVPTELTPVLPAATAAISDARNGRELDAVDQRALIEVDDSDGFTAGVRDVERRAVEAHRHLVRKLTDRDRIEETLLDGIENFDAVVAGVGNVHAIARFVQHDVFETLRVAGSADWSRVRNGGDGINDAALIALPVIHVDANGGRDVNRIARNQVHVQAPCRCFRYRDSFRRNAGHRCGPDPL
jgi:hypothetical protein